MSLIWPAAESTQTVQALQHPSGEGPPSTNKEVEIRSLKSEIDILKKQIAGQHFHILIFFIVTFQLERKQVLFLSDDTSCNPLTKLVFDDSKW